MTYLPSRPASGELLMLKIICSVGSSTATRGRRGGLSASLIVSPISTSSRPTSATMSPAVASVDLARGRACRRRERRRLCTSVDSPSACISATCWPGLMRAGVDAADGDAADVVGPVERGDQHLQRRIGIDLRAGDRLRAPCRTAAASSRPARRDRAWRSRRCRWRRCAGSRPARARRPVP